MSETKVTVVGANEVGVECARRIAARGDVEVALIDPEPGLARARAFDINRALALSDDAPRTRGGDSQDLGAGSAIAVIAESPAEVRGLDAVDALERCRDIVADASVEIATRSPDAVLIVIAEPHELGCHFALASSGFPRGRVIGIGAMQASARLRLAIAEELGFAVADVQLTVLGSSADGAGRVIGPASVCGAPLASMLDARRIDEIWREQTSPPARTERAPEPLSAATAAAQLVGGVVGGQDRLHCCAAFCRGEYGVDSAFVAVPCRLGPGGIAEIVELPLGEEPLARLQAAGEAVRAQAKAGR